MLKLKLDVKDQKKESKGQKQSDEIQNQNQEFLSHETRTPVRG